MVWALFSLCFCLSASGSTLPPLHHLKLHFRKRLVDEHADLFPTMTAVNRYLDNMNKLNQIQQKLHNFLSGELKVCDGIERRETEHFAEMVATAQTQSPDQLPYLFEGDIVLTDGQMDELLNNAYTQLELMRRCSKGSGEKCDEQFDYKMLRKRTLTSNLRERWNSFPIPYFVDPKVNRTAVEEGIANWMRSTCLTFREVSSLGDSQAGLQFVFGSGCYSAIGKLQNGRPQKVSIGAACDNPFVVSHEIAHSLGYFHEQSRFDRNDFVRVQVKNIKSGFLNQFTSFSRSQENTFGVSYDFGSVMHYNAYAFSSSGLSSIQTLNSNYQNTIGQRFQLSFNDIKKMNLAYCDSICPFELPCQRSGYTDPKACERCRCPDGLSGRFCDRMAITNTECGELRLQAADRERTLSHFGVGGCNFLIKAPIGARVALSFDSVRFVDANTPCQKESYVEVRYRNDLGSVGARFCESDQKGSFVSESNEVIVLYRSASKQNSFGLRYQRKV